MLKHSDFMYSGFIRGFICCFIYFTHDLVQQKMHRKTLLLDVEVKIHTVTFEGISNENG